jgi:S-formylglutathione hydrolase FrmB
MMRPMRHAPAFALAVVAACGPSQPTRTQTQTEMPATNRPPGPPSPSRVETRSFSSAALGVDKDYVIYLPAGYDTLPDRRWPVLYYLHGLTGDETNWAQLGGMAEAADKLALRAIVVMPDGDDGFYTDAATDYDYDQCLADGTGLFIASAPKAETCVRRRRYQTYIVDDLVAHVDATYRTISSRDGRGIAGLSMGGFGALQIAMRHEDRFAAAASHSGVDALLYRGPHPYVAGKAEILTDAALWGRGIGPIGTWIRDIFGPDIENWRAHDPAFLVDKLKDGDLALYLDCGTEDGFLLHDGAAYLHDLLVAKDIGHVFFLGPGGHDFDFWRARLPESLAFLTAHVSPLK